MDKKMRQAIKCSTRDKLGETPFYTHATDLTLKSFIHAFIFDKDLMATTIFKMRVATKTGNLFMRLDTIVCVLSSLNL